ncbi:hypothetical protein SEA_MCKLOVIN_59 [Gordonia phage Mcklovin]|uniref:Uncharacterized protein n=1 Tax=Gordonia phage Mcklovin TaxID=2652881 RepID=A0A5P8DCX0_9CAUD|nr:hypothetical protein PP514_gp59 [Gordonia phage Mcklovin]QFP96844.1 hypothetical protein SEA_MCKLOVIN_59 [Gordonia phage Mcklovin]
MTADPANEEALVALVASAIQAGRYSGHMFPATSPLDFADARRIVAAIRDSGLTVIALPEPTGSDDTGCHEWLDGEVCIGKPGNGRIRCCLEDPRMSDDEAAELGARADARRLLQGITPGPWVAEYMPQETSYPSDSYHIVTKSHGDLVAVSDDQAESLIEGPHAEFGKDAEFIAAAPTLVDRLLAELDQAKTLIGRIADDAGADPDEDPDDLCNWVAELRSGASDAETHRMANHRLVATLKQVRELHGAVMLHDWVCTACDEPWPCDTLRILDGGAR